MIYILIVNQGKYFIGLWYLLLVSVRGGEENEFVEESKNPCENNLIYDCFECDTKLAKVRFFV